MGNIDEKIKNSARRSQDERAIKKQLDIAKEKSKGFDNGNKSIDQPHRLVKRRAMDCGNPNCYLCGNPRRNPWLKKERLTGQERRMFQDLDTKRNKRGNGLTNDQAE